MPTFDRPSRGNTMKKTTLLVCLLMAYTHCMQAQIGDVSPRYLLWNYAGLQTATMTNYTGEKKSAFGLWIIGIPQWTPAFKIKKKLFLGAFVGIEIGMGFASNVEIMAKIPLGLQAGYLITPDLYAAVRCYSVITATALLRTSNDDGRVFGGSICYKNLTLDYHNNVNVTHRGGLFTYNMDFMNTHLFAKYMLKSKDKNSPYWIGVRYDKYKLKPPVDDGIFKATTIDFLVGKIISY
jgi:hypothetical protein